MMKRLLFISLFVFAGYCAFTQNNPLEKSAALRMEKEPLENVLDVITKQTGVRFSYNSQMLNPKKEITINAQSKTVKEILSIIIPANVSYKVMGEHIVFYKENGENGESRKQEAGSRKQEAGSRKEEGSEGVKERGSEGVKERGSEGVKDENSSSDNGNAPDSCLDSVSFTNTEEMKTLLTELMLAATMAVTPVFAQDTIGGVMERGNEGVMERGNEGVRENGEKCKPFQITFIYPLGSGFAKAAEKCYHISINVLGGVTGQTKGIELGGLFNINRYGAMGAQFAGLFNIAADCDAKMFSRNAQFGGIFNVTAKGTSAQFGGIFNVGDTAYFQAGGIFNVANKAGFQAGGIFNMAKEAGFQGGGIFNITQKAGAQIAGIFNHGDTTHFQAAGIWNFAKETKCQLAGIANIAQKSACQIGGIFNCTKQGRFQMGLINVRDTADGVSLGLINIVKHGGVLEAGIEAGEFVHTALTFRSGVQRLYSIITVGYNFTQKYWSVGTGLGTGFKLIGNLGLNLELTNTTLYKTFYEHPWHNTLTQFRPVLNYRFAKHFKIYAGPSFNLLIQHYNGPILAIYPPENHHKINAPYSIISRTINNTKLDMWIGVTGGIKF